MSFGLSLMDLRGCRRRWKAKSEQKARGAGWQQHGCCAQTLRGLEVLGIPAVLRGFILPKPARAGCALPRAASEEKLLPAGRAEVSKAG